jgi:hypothetical protein
MKKCTTTRDLGPKAAQCLEISKIVRCNFQVFLKE